MFLSDLTEKEKEVFLGLAYLAMESSGRIEESEKRVFEAYKYECKQPNYKYEGTPLDILLENLRHSPLSSKKIILMELCGIWAADGVWDEGEYAMLYKVAHVFGIPETEANRIKRCSKEIGDLIQEGISLIYRS